jgi:hypothetical protein
MKFGNLPIAEDPDHPTEEEIEQTTKAVATYEAVFSTH